MQTAIVPKQQQNPTQTGDEEGGVRDGSGLSERVQLGAQDALDDGV
jgi:hypothetical protein